MYEGSKSNNLALLNALDREVFSCEQKAKRSRDGRLKLKKLEDEYKQYSDVLVILKKALKEMGDLAKELQEYLGNKKKNGLSAIRAGIIATRSIIPNSSPITLEVDGNKAWLANKKGHSVMKVEGGAFRSIISVFMRERLLKSSNYIENLIIDEALATLDPENSAEFSKYLSVMAQNTPMLVIEQKDSIYSSVDHVCYEFQKFNERSRVVRGEVKCTN
jgi:hypothetical protein